MSTASSPHGDASASRVAAMIGVDHYRDADAVQRLVDDALLALALPASFVRPGRPRRPQAELDQGARRATSRRPATGSTSSPTRSVIEAVARWVAQQLDGRGSDHHLRCAADRFVVRHAAAVLRPR